MKWAWRIGQVAGIGIFSEPMLVFIALFLWIGAGAEDTSVQVKSSLSGVRVREMMISEYHTLTPGEPVAHAVEVALKSFQQDFPVLREGELVGMLTLRDMLHGLAQQGREVPIHRIMQRQFAFAAPSDLLENVVAHLNDSDLGAVPIVEKGRLVGLVTRDHLGEFLMVQDALCQSSGDRAMPAW